MARLLIHVEGETEEDFVNEVLRDYLVNAGYESVSARIVGNARLRHRRGGIRSWPQVRKEIINHLRQDARCIATTMVDFYGLPRQGHRAWPGRAEARGLQAALRASHLQEALRADIGNEFGPGFDVRRFIPFVVMHEFEGLLFSDCTAFAEGIGRSDLEADFKEIRNAFATPEDINDSRDTCPSRRVQALMPVYDKRLHGTLAALEIGLARIRAQCPHFDGWIKELESQIR